MTPQRQCRFTPLRQQPLVLVLAQVRFSALRRMADYVGAIRDDFRRTGFPIEHDEKVQQITVSAAGVNVTEQVQWVSRTTDERWSLILAENAVVLQTTAYERFEDFAGKLSAALHTVRTHTEQEAWGVVERVGLRYVNLVRPREGEDHRMYLRPGLHGVSDEMFLPGTPRVQVESVGRTAVGERQGTLIVRVSQNDKGFDVPPDLLGAAPRRSTGVIPGELVSLIDMDHFMEARIEPTIDQVIELTYLLHDQLIETFHEHVVTPEAIEVWR